MGILSPLVAPALLALVAPAACYAPRLPDCTTPCSSDLDCTPGQICGAEGYCVAPDRICTPEHPAGPDAPPLPPVQLSVIVKDGTVTVKLEARELSVCDGMGSQERTCIFDVPQQARLSLIASPHARYKFDKWLNACEGQSATCSLILTASHTDARARFRPE